MTRGEICTGCIKLEKAAKKFGGDKYTGYLRSPNAAMNTVTVYIPQSLSRPGNSSGCRQNLYLTICNYPLSTDVVKSEDLIKTYRFLLDKPAKSGGGDRYIAASDPDFNIYLPQMFSRTVGEDDRGVALRQITMLVATSRPISSSTSTGTANTEAVGSGTPDQEDRKRTISATSSNSSSSSSSSSGRRVTSETPASPDTARKVRRIICDSDDEEEEEPRATATATATTTTTAAAEATATATVSSDIVVQEDTHVAEAIESKQPC